MTPFLGGKMKNLLLVLLFVCGLTPMLSHADYIRPGPRPAPYPGNPGRPDPYPGPAPRPEPRPPRPNPGPGYPPPPNYYTEYVSCSSYGYRYTECYYNTYGLYSVRIYQQNSYDACIWNSTAGVYGDRLWVDRGCSATFEIIRRY